MTTQNVPEQNEANVLWESPFTGCALPLLAVFIGCICVLFVYQREHNRRESQPKTDYRSIPPEWITYRQTAVFPCSVFGQPTCFALRNDSTFIIGTADPPTLLFIDGNGTLQRKIDLPEEPKAVVCGTSETILTDKIIVAHPKHITVYTIEGKAEISWKLPDQKSAIQSLVLTPHHLFAADSGKHSIYRFDTDGNLDLTFGEGFVVYASPITMTYSPYSGLLYIANPGKHRIEVFTPDGIYKPELSWGEPSVNLSGFAGCCNPIGLATLDDGRILTVEKSVSRIKIFKTNGRLDGVVAGSSILEAPPQESGRTSPKPNQHYFAAVVLSDGHIAVFDFSFVVIRVFVPL